MQVISLLLFTLLHFTAARKPSNAILLSSVKSLTLRGDQLTSAHRVKAIPQLKCIGGNAKGLYDVDVMRCKNTGSEYDAEDISWTCQANLPPEFKLGSTEVICEGYASSDDPYVLKGSCGVEYRLALTELGQSKYGNRKASSRVFSHGEEQPSTFFTIAFWLIFLGIVGFFLYKIFIEGTGANRRINDGFRRYYGGGGGGAGGDDNDPPPPYSRRPPRPAPKASRPQGEQGWRPGFWSGAAAGAAATYAFGNRGNTRTQTAQAGPSNWFNTGARNTASTTSNNNSGWGSSQTSNASPSSSRYESTGFGGTRRR
ncbi:hypothetical protein AMS68_004296 [Peltaster fructicola]|uniref:Store-operated calcium entry-associated regulatory factor n=1 Tax=Peltaster fructicola TaxID=286661 RepID=A0A6H0XVY5_9PEZI|nr:hypothetical protein AMS68_004296 [Peltaster fructicola]